MTTFTAADAQTTEFDPADFLEDLDDISEYLKLALADENVEELSMTLADCWRAYCRNVRPEAAEEHPEFAGLLSNAARGDLALLPMLLRAMKLRASFTLLEAPASAAA